MATGVVAGGGGSGTLPALISTPLTRRLGIRHPVLLAGMASVSNADLAAAVTNAGGLGVVGGALVPPSKLRELVRELKSKIAPGAPFGVDLLLPKVGGSARATNYDYTKGALAELINIVVEEGARLFVCAVGVPPRWAVDKLHAHGVLVMNMVGLPKHVAPALDAGVDIVCAQGTEAGGHTGDVATMPLVPQCVDLCRGRVSPLDGAPVAVVGAGGIFDGRGVAAVLALGAQAAWVGTRFVAAAEAGASPVHQQAVVDSPSESTVRTLIYSGRPMRVQRTPYITEWETTRRGEAAALLAKGKRVHKAELERRERADDPLDFTATYPRIFGQACGGVTRVTPAAEIVDDLVRGAAEALALSAALIVGPGAVVGGSASGGAGAGFAGDRPKL